MSHEASEQIFLYLSQECGLDVQQITPNTSLFLSGRLDSIDVIQLIVFLEKKFAIKINAFDVSLERLDSVSKILAFLETKGITTCALSD